MTDEYILDKLNLTTASPQIQQSSIASVRSIAESRMILLLDEILTDEQRQKLDELQSTQDGGEQSASWFFAQFPQLQELYDGIIEDIVTDEKFHPKVG